MRTKKSWITFGLGAVLMLAAVQALYASGVLDRDQRRLDRARDVHAEEVQRALDAFNTRVDRANNSISRVYEQLIDRYESRGERSVATQLREELEQIIASTRLVPAGSNGDDDSYRALIELIGPSIVNANGRPIESAALAEANYVILYFSAEWCGPCKRFTPNLIQFHQQFSQSARVATLLVSSDHTEEQMFRYMRESSMPWHAVPYDRATDRSRWQQYAGRGIPHVVVLDRGGDVVFRSSYPPTPDDILQQFAQRLRQ